ncbi:MAG: DUF1838 family protein [Gammaproteobacteria bacterium]|nr:DUF1838 family protein [Gammaproteobacteria bacterium]
MFSRFWTSRVFDAERRRLVKGGLATAGCLAFGDFAMADSPARALDRQNPRDNLHAWIKIYSDIEGHVDIYSRFNGNIFAVIGDRAPLRPLLGFEGFAVNRVVPQADGAFHAFINEVAFYKDPATDRIIDAWHNPFTDEQVEVFQLHAGPLTSRLDTVRKFEQPDGGFVERPFILPWFVLDDDAFISIEFNDVRDNPLQPDEWPRESVGEKIRVSESMQFMTKTSLLEDAAVTRVNPTMSWTLMRSWLPWMLMGRHEGHLLYRNVVQKVGGIDEIPRRIVDRTEKHFPDYLISPPDDSWGQFQTSYKIFKAEREPTR